MKTLYILISGSRSIPPKISNNILDKFYEEKQLYRFNICIVGGGCSKGVDSGLERWCEKWGMVYKEMKADWERYGKKAGFLRNMEMIKYVKERNGGCICVWDGMSKGCKHVIDNWKGKHLVVLNP